VDQRIPIAAAGFEQEDALVGILAQARRDGTTCGAGSDDDVGMALAHRYASDAFKDEWRVAPSQGR
jgi:hypothetical protein